MKRILLGAICLLTLWFLLKTEGPLPLPAALEKIHKSLTGRLRAPSTVTPNSPYKSKEVIPDKVTSTSSRTSTGTSFSYAEEVQSVNELAKQLPHSQQQLLSVVIQEDIFKKEKSEVHPHSLNEITENQMGAIKVMALRALMTKGTDESIRNDLTYVIQKAQDPTIVKIASAARDSLDKGRPFFKDFLDAIGNRTL